MALAWSPITSPLPDDRVNMTRAACGPFRATSYALEPIEDRFYFDIDFVSPVDASQSPLVKGYGGEVKTGYFTSSAACQREATLRLQKLAAQMTSAIGTIK